MPKQAGMLTPRAIDALKADGRYFVGGAQGLHLRIEGGSKTWVVRLMIAGKRADIGLGPKAELSLADAREAARDLRKLVRAGIDPRAERREKAAAAKAEAKNSLTFDQAAMAYVEAKKSGWKNEKHAKQWAATLETYAFAVIGKLAVSKITHIDIMSVIKPIWETKSETASRLRGRIEQILAWSTVNGHRTGDNPARWRGHLDQLLPAPAAVKKVEHHAALPYAHMGSLMAELRLRDGISPRALEFAILCASRSGEVREATWAEIDLEAALWTIPAKRMKGKREHVVPLSPAAVALLGAMQALPRIVANVPLERSMDANFSPYVFQAPRGGPLSDMSLTAVLKRMGHGDLTQHGFRSSFRDWAGETTAHPREVIEHALAHQLKNKAEASYQRGIYLQKRRALMDDWSTYCGQSDNRKAAIASIDRDIAEHPERYDYADIPDLKSTKRKPMIYIENEGAIFKGYSNSVPLLIWNLQKQDWQRYSGKVPKPEGWGNTVSEKEASEYMSV